MTAIRSYVPPSIQKDKQTKSNLIDDEVTAIRAALDPHKVLRLMVVIQVSQQPASGKIEIKNFKILRIS